MVKIAVSVLFAAAFATSVLAQDFTPSTVDEILARDAGSLSAEDSSLFSRAAAKVMNDLFSREDLSEMIGRDVDELSQRDLEELLQREVDVSEDVIAARGFTEYIDDSALVARQEGGEAAEGAEGGAAAPPSAPSSAPTPAASGTPKGAPTGAPKPTDGQPKSTVWGRVCSWFRSLFMGGPKKADAAKKGGKHAHKAKAAPKPDAAAKKPEAPAAPAKEEGAPAPAEAEGAQAPAEARELLEEPVERSFGDEDIEEFAERFYDDEAFEEREYEDLDEVLARDVDDLLERELDDVYYERDFDGVWDEELLTRALDVLSQIDELD